MTAIPMLVAAGWLLAQAPAAPPVPAAPGPAAKTAKDPMVCKAVVPLGSRLGGRKTCLPRSVWEQQRRDARDATDTVQRMGHGPFDTSK